MMKLKCAGLPGIFSLFILLLICHPPALAQASESVAGKWEGIINLPGTELNVLILLQQDDADWSGTISIPQQGAKDLPLSGISVDGPKVRFKIAGIPGEPTFDGALLEDGRIEGSFTQGGQTFPFELEPGGAGADTAREALLGFDELVVQALEDFRVPGVAIGIVLNGDPVLVKGYGKRKLESAEPVTADTLFAIGSCSKAFTTFVLASLVDEGKLDWDDPVRKHLPEFQLSDEYASTHLTVRDLVTHRSGLPRHDLFWYNSDLSRQELVQRLRFLEPFADLRQRYHYQNLMYLTAGYLVERLTGISWEEAVTGRILQPLGMKRSNFSVADSLKDADFAAPYVERDRELKLVPFRPLDNIGPAGSINSSVNEMLEWIKVNLEQHDQELIKQSTLREMHTPQTIVGGYPVEPEAFLSTYGLGWMIQSYRGRYNVLHGGAIDGFSALVSLFPMDGLGIVVLANKSGAGINGLLINHVVDHILGLETKPWLAEALVKRNKGLEAVEQAEKKREMTRVKGTSTSHPLSDYAGQYEHPGYGVASVELLNGELTATYNRIVTALEHWHYDVFNGLESEDPVFENFKFEFRLNTRGEVDALAVALDPEVESIVFQRKPDARLFEPDFLSKLTGKFTLATGVITVELKGSTLFASVSGQPVFELVPRRGVEFDLKGVSGFSVRFVLDESERVTEIQLIQPNGVFVATPAEGPQ